MSAMAWGLVVYIIFFFVVGIGMYYLVQQSGRRYIICGKSLPFFLVGTMLFAQSLDANATMGMQQGYLAADGGLDSSSPLAWPYAFLCAGASTRNP